MAISPKFPNRRMTRYAKILYIHFRHIEDLEAAFDIVARILEEKSKKECNLTRLNAMTDTIAADTIDGFEYIWYRASWDVNAEIA